MFVCSDGRPPESLRVPALAAQLAEPAALVGELAQGDDPHAVDRSLLDRRHAQSTQICELSPTMKRCARGF